MKVPVYDVTTVLLSQLKSHPPRLQISAAGYVRTGGYTAPELRLVELTSEGELVYDFVAIPPTGVVTQAVLPITAEALYEGDLASVGLVTVRGEEGDKVTAPLWELRASDSVVSGSIPSSLIRSRQRVTLEEIIGCTVRVIRPGDAVTLDFRRDRLNLSLNESGVITTYGFF